MPDVKHFDPDAVLDEVVEVFWQQGMPATGIQALVTRTGVSRSSLYATFGSKGGLYAAALRRYAERHSAPAFARMATDPSGLPAIEGFFAGLIRKRTSGGSVGWGCMITNAHAGPESADPVVRALLDTHHRQLHEALRAALDTAAGLGQLRGDADPDEAAIVLSSLAYGINLRSRAGANARLLRATVQAALAPLRATTPSQPSRPSHTSSPEEPSR